MSLTINTNIAATRAKVPGEQSPKTTEELGSSVEWKKNNRSGRRSLAA